MSFCMHKCMFHMQEHMHFDAKWWQTQADLINLWCCKSWNAANLEACHSSVECWTSFCCSRRSKGDKGKWDFEANLRGSNSIFWGFETKCWHKITLLCQQLTTWNQVHPTQFLTLIKMHYLSGWQLQPQQSKSAKIGVLKPQLSQQWQTLACWNLVIPTQEKQEIKSLDSLLCLKQVENFGSISALFWGFPCFGVFRRPETVPSQEQAPTYVFFRCLSRLSGVLGALGKMLPDFPAVSKAQKIPAKQRNTENIIEMPLTNKRHI